MAGYFNDADAGSDTDGDGAGAAAADSDSLDNFIASDNSEEDENDDGDDDGPEETAPVRRRSVLQNSDDSDDEGAELRRLAADLEARHGNRDDDDDDEDGDEGVAGTAEQVASDEEWDGVIPAAPEPELDASIEHGGRPSRLSSAADLGRRESMLEKLRRKRSSQAKAWAEQDVATAAAATAVEEAAHFCSALPLSAHSRRMPVRPLKREMQ